MDKGEVLRTTKLALAALGVVTAASVTVGVSTASAAPERGAPELSLPPPTGPHQVGTTSVHLVDRSRRDPLRPEVPYRELMVSVWYPARDTAGRPTARHMEPGAANVFDELLAPNRGVPRGLVDWAATRTSGHLDAPPDRRGHRPVLLYSAGLGDPRTWNTTLVQELASRGYVVVTIDHTYEAAAVEFPGGRVARSVLFDQQPTPELLRTILNTRVADTRFVLDWLRRKESGALATADTHRVGMVGHSAGGFTGLQTMYDDPRIGVGVNLDGTVGIAPRDVPGIELSPVAANGLRRPYLLFGRTEGGHHARYSWGELWNNSRTWKRDLHLRGAEHMTFTESAVLLPQIDRQVDIGDISKEIGTVDPARAFAATRDYTVAFFDKWLRHKDSGLLNGESPAYPDVGFIK